MGSEPIDHAVTIFNSILEMNKSKKKLSYLLFVDLKEAYDRVDRRAYKTYRHKTYHHKTYHHKT